MYKKLVKLDKNGYFTEVDPIALRRSALALKEYIEREIRPEDDEYDIWGQALPLCEGVLNGTLPLPLVFHDLPLKYPSREGLLPEGFNKPWAYFCVDATGGAERVSEPVIIDGERYCETEFEEPGDWPEVVLRHEDERRRESMGANYVPVTR